jgi:hypothetical protein
MRVDPSIIDVSKRSSLPYLVWKTDDNNLGLPSSIFIRQINEDGVTFDDASPVRTIMRADEPDDLNVVEGPSIVYLEPFYYLIFSGQHYN